jgi:hypothetical protein
LIDKFWDEGKWVSILDSPFVYWAIVLYRAKFTILLLDVEESAFVWALRWADCSSFKVFFDKFSELL